jgi:hypothetical protein
MSGAVEDSKCITIDAAENVYITGYFKDTGDFDPGSGIFNLTSLGGEDIFIGELNASGNFVWAKQIGGTGYDRGGINSFGRLSKYLLYRILWSNGRF